MVELKESDVQDVVQQQLTERGEYSPLELLISTGRLLTIDFEEWRRGKHETLDKLFINSRVIKSLLSEAESYATSIGLVRESYGWSPWRGSGQPLKVSRYSDLTQLLACRYVPDRHNLQFDLFYDHTGAAIENSVISALIEGNLEGIEQQLTNLYRIEPCHPDLGLYEHLKRYIAHCSKALCRADTLAKEYRVLAEKIIPIAHAAMKVRVAEFTEPYWRRLIECCKEIACEQRPELDLLSRLYWEVEEWRGIVEATEVELAQQLDVNILIRRALAFYYLHLTGHYYRIWFLLAGLDIDNFAGLIADQPDQSLQSLWADFEEYEGLNSGDFPAFSLLVSPTLRTVISVPLFVDTGLADSALELEAPSVSIEHRERLLKTQQLYGVVDELIEVDQVSAVDLGRDHAERSICLRKQLNETSPALMKIYLETRFI